MEGCQFSYMDLLDDHKLADPPRTIGLKEFLLDLSKLALDL